MNRRLMFLSIGFTAAVFLCQFFGENTIVLCIAAVVAIAISLVFTIKGYRKAAALLLLGIFLGVFRNSDCIEHTKERISGYVQGEVYPISVIATDYSKETEKNGRIYFECVIDSVQGEKAEEHVRAIVYYPEIGKSIKPGDVLSCYAQLTVPENKESFPSYTYNKTRGIDFIIFAEKGGVLNPCRKIPFKYFHKVIGNSIKDQIGRLLPKKEAGFLTALLTGDKSALSDSFKEELTTAGLSHTVAVSGMHVSFLVGLIVFLAGKRFAPFAAIPVMLIFMLVAGSTPSVVRAVIMQSFVLISPLIMRQADSLTSLFAALLVILFINPYAAGDMGLQLSFAAVLGIILISENMRNYIINKLHICTRGAVGKFAGKIVTSVAVTVGATVFTLPITVCYFDMVSVISMLSNIAVMWGISFVFSAGTAIVALSYISIGASSSLSGFLLHVIRWVEKSVQMLSEIPHAGVYTRNIWAIGGFTAAYAIIVIWGIFKGKKSRGAKITVAALSLLCPAFLMISVYSPEIEDIRLTVFDVGQGLSVMAEHGDKRVIIDCGGNRMNAGDIVYKKLNENNTRRVDAVILTHIHDDHINGVEKLLEKAIVKQLYIPAGLMGDIKIKGVLDAAKEKKTIIRAVDRNIELYFDGMAVDLFYYDEVKKKDDISLAVMLRQGDFEAIITGDMDGSGEKCLIADMYLPDTEVYIAGHHGAKTSSTDEFLDIIYPEFSVISVGEKNIYGHPATETIERFMERGIYTVCTDECGDIVFNSSRFAEIYRYPGR